MGGGAGMTTGADTWMIGVVMGGGIGARTWGATVGGGGASTTVAVVGTATGSATGAGTGGGAGARAKGWGVAGEGRPSTGAWTRKTITPPSPRVTAPRTSQGFQVPPRVGALR